MSSKIIAYLSLSLSCLLETNATTVCELSDTTISMSEVPVTSHTSGTRKLSGFAINGEVITSGELTRAACCSLGESFTINLWNAGSDATMVYAPLHGAIIYAVFRYALNRY